MTINVEKPSTTDMLRYLDRMETLELCIANSPNHPMVEGWKRDLEHYANLYAWANDSYYMWAKAQARQKKSFIQRLFKR